MQNYDISESPEILREFLNQLQIGRAYSSLTIYNYYIDLRLFFRFLLCQKNDLPMTAIDGILVTEIDLTFIQEIRKQDAVAFLAWITTEKAAKERTRNRKIAVLKSFYQFLLIEEYVEKNIMLGIPMAKAPKSLPKYLVEEDIALLLTQVTDDHWVRDTAVILLMMSSGLRVSEVSALNLSSFSGDSLLVFGKGKKERQVYLSTKTLDAVEDYLEIRPDLDCEALFLSNRSSRFTVRGIQDMVKKYLRKIGKDGYSCHKLRHTAATQLLNSGANIREIQEILGHESISTTEIYTHVSNSELKRAVGRLQW